MHETEKKIIITTDDVIGKKEQQTQDAIRAILKAKQQFPELSASILVTANPLLVAKYKDYLLHMDPGLHFDLFEYDIPQDELGLFGEHGMLRELLSKRENNEQTPPIPNAWKPYIKKEMHRQANLFKAILGTDPSHLSYHYGMHYFDELYELYGEFAKETDIPYRWDSMRSQVAAPSTNHPDALLDGLNKNLIGEQHVLAELARLDFAAKLNGNGHDQAIGELMLHLREGFGPEGTQATTFAKPGLRRQIEHAGFQIVPWEHVKRRTKP